MHNEKLYVLYSSPNIMMMNSRFDEIGQTVHMGRNYINAYKILAETPGSKRPLEGQINA
jgi:hypothetical protein